MMRSAVSAERLRAQIQKIRPHAFLKQWHIHLTVCFLLVSLAVRSIPFVPQSLALPCLDLAGCLAEDSGAPGSNTEPCWKPVCSDGQQQIQLHLSVAVKPAVWARGTRWDRRGGVCACEYVCVHVCVCVNVSVSGGWRLQQRGTDWDVKRERGGRRGREREGGLSQQQLSEWAGVTVCLPGPQIYNKRDTIQVWIHFHSLHWFVWAYFMGHLVQRNNRWLPGENVSALLFNQLPPIWK